MAAEYSLNSVVRDDAKKSARDARAEGRVPGVVYGNHKDPQAIAVEYSDLLRTYRKAGTSSLVSLNVNGEDQDVLIHDMVIHPVRQEMWHVDFLRVNPNEKVTAHVHVRFTGSSPAVKNLGGVMVVGHDTLEIRCLPQRLLPEIVVDISELKEIHDHITIADLGLKADVYEVLHLDPTSVICSVTGRAASKDEEESPTEGEETEA